MKAVVYDAPRSFTVTDVPVPEPGPGEVRIKVLAAGVCGTDLHLHEGQFLAVYPMTPGHETVGLIDALGEGVDDFKVGEQVVINPNAACGSCEYCREGRRLLCGNFSGIGSTLPGGFAEFVLAPIAQVFSAEGLPVETAVFTEPTSCVAHGIDVIAPRHGSTALVFGAGPTGIILAQLLKAAGASHVRIAAPTQFKLDTAVELGVDDSYTMNRGDLPGDLEKLRELSGGSGYDIVVDATGVPAIAEALVPMTRNGGTAVFYGVADESATISISPYDVFRREITIKGSFAEIESFPQALAALRAGRARTDGIITHRFGLDDYGTALDTVRSDKSANKVIITP
ncbi:zinc-dependent alcohol dehydrogenase family protein [Piscicoccus intestinalis]|uniref:zinc-dependent alcohol dehydrogenase family protein n=1 Tax=Piscicoccus intestinalis TaxID=746033 RepID=UPI0008397773|nr:zinc-dependent alcohol dehydrogenase family protein [Piscicoccus intestinalis]